MLNLFEMIPCYSGYAVVGYLLGGPAGGWAGVGLVTLLYARQVWVAARGTEFAADPNTAPSLDAAPSAQEPPHEDDPRPAA